MIAGTLLGILLIPLLYVAVQTVREAAKAKFTRASVTEAGPAQRTNTPHDQT